MLFNRVRYYFIIMRDNIQLLNDFEVYIEKYFAKICNINRAAVGREVDIANLSKTFSNVY